MAMFITIGFNTMNFATRQLLSNRQLEAIAKSLQASYFGCWLEWVADAEILSSVMRKQSGECV
jgi:hypothetical protein